MVLLCLPCNALITAGEHDVELKNYNIIMMIVWGKRAFDILQVIHV